ncbi:NAD-dependent epimerase/dehydratase family protein [Rhodococcus qingshengii]|uniref:NAD-dependent epimerase/dehydratase family protein n=1 Tax=Rhodococcus qingshengii TaxID=334542 RepID=UPI001BEC22C9|nr:NAD-dependent epimerase/dehydratase family protein [Rhodococcus qingshengii]MBT2271364.1 NAD-dependent epimerase/dehydratase family protein [Rhodococcus qingshengii]
MKLVIAGATGLVGNAVIEQIGGRTGVEIIGLSRRGRDDANGVRYVGVDLTRPDGAQSITGDLTGATHLVFAAVDERPDGLLDAWRGATDHAATNGSMLGGLLDVLSRVAPDLEHIVLLHGTKAYGTHLGALDVPARESDPRLLIPGFYEMQHDIVRRHVARHGGAWTILRPTTIIGSTRSGSASILLCVAFYAAVCAELGHPFRFPGTNTDRVWQAIDVGMLARVIDWSLDNAATYDEIFNVANGDCVTWESLWPHLAAEFDLQVAPTTITSMASLMRDKGPLWKAIVERDGLAPTDLDTLPWQTADFHMNRDHHAYASTHKLNRAGFTETVDTIDMFARYIAELRSSTLIGRSGHQR